jgi:hypothetical protein
MGDTYKGESFAKKLARLYFWVQVRELLGDARFYRQTHLVLASREGGDISVLLGMGVDPKRILAVESNAEAAAICSQKFPSVRVVYGGVASIASAPELASETIASAFLDFCSPLNEGVVDTAFRVVQRALGDGAALGVALLRGRERDAVRDIVLDPTLKEEAERVAGLIQQQRGLPPAELGAQVWDRDLVLQTELTRRSGLWRLGWGLIRIGGLHYQSATSTSRGVPMMITLWRVHRERPRASRRAFVRRYLNTAEKVWRSHDFFMRVPSVEDTDAATRVAALSLEEHGEVAIAYTESALPYARAARLPTGRAHLLLNVPRTTVSAWKAHAERGTYDAEVRA